MTQFHLGQRWISEPEPELGLGTVVQVEGDRVSLLYPASGELRQYSQAGAPLKRISFGPGDSVRTHQGVEIRVEHVRQEEGVITYVGDGVEVPETELSDRISFHGAEDRLLSGHLDDPGRFELRARTLRFSHAARQSAVRGFVGGRIDLIPHQLFIAHEVSGRYAPRVMLSDEVGLGKTIEACLILHRLLLTGRAQRVLVVVPESLVNQWFVEMLRRFHLWMHIYDEERCAAIEAGEPGVNPFLDDQLIVCSLGFLAQSRRRSDQVVDAGWDVLVVDEAHHLAWSPESVSAEYALVERLGEAAEGLLLLTATPEQLGPESHFARLRLLDPERYQDYQTYQEETKDYRMIAEVIDCLEQARELSPRQQGFLERVFEKEPDRLRTGLASASARKEFLTDLLDLHGPGRVLFRNTRAAMSGFPKRRIHVEPLQAARDHADWIDRVSTEFAQDVGEVAWESRCSLQGDPRVRWLASLLDQLAPQKVLLICRGPEKVLALDEALRQEVNLKVGLFHEGLSLLQRDRNAAWFAEEDGARLLICSEIGSEGRNFQFAHHLVLFDLPLNPEILEQRIGRLDRIGQSSEINIHVPYLQGSPHEVLTRWYEEGLSAFARNLEGGNELLRKFGRSVHDLALEFPVKPAEEAEAELRPLLAETQTAYAELLHRLEQGRDRLLERNSFRPGLARQLVATIRSQDNDPALEDYLLDVFEHFGVQVEDLASHTYRLDAHGVTTDAFPALPEEGLMVTFARARALSREDVAFLSWDHPIVTGAMDLVLGSELGNASFALWPHPTKRELLLETEYVLETLASPRLHVDRFLPPTPIRSVVGSDRLEVTDSCSTPQWELELRSGNPVRLLDRPAVTKELLPDLLEVTERFAQERAETLMRSSQAQMEAVMDHEVARLKSLGQVNPDVRPLEIALAERQRSELTEAIQQARIRLDSVRLIWHGSAEHL